MTRLILALVAIKAARLVIRGVAAGAYLRGAVDTLDHLPYYATPPACPLHTPTTEGNPQP